MCVSPLNGGTLVSNYRKSNLYFDDKRWAEPGQGFKAFDLVFHKKGNLVVKCMSAICADIDPVDLRNKNTVFELADFVIQE